MEKFIIIIIMIIVIFETMYLTRFMIFNLIFFFFAVAFLWLDIKNIISIISMLLGIYGKDEYSDVN